MALPIESTPMATEWALRQRNIRLGTSHLVFATAPEFVHARVDGKQKCRVRTAFPKGTDKHPFPHARVDMMGADGTTILSTNVMVELARLTKA